MTRIRTAATLTASTVAVLALALGAASPALAAEPTVDGDGIVTIGAAHWQVDEYGLAYGWDAADVYDLSGYIYYPGEFYYDNYLYCGTGIADADVVVESNGDLTITCPSGPFGSTGLTGSLTFRFYAQSESGYLMRQLVTLTNETDAPIELADGIFAYYYDGYTGTQGGPGFITSSGGDTVGADDTGYISHDPSGASVVETEVWAPNGSAPGAGIVGDSHPAITYTEDATFAAGETKYFVNFTNMVIPATQDEEGAAAAFEIASAQTEEYTDFSGRLVEGLPEGLPVVAWGMTPVAPAPIVPTLANTGSDVSALGVAGLAALLAAAAGLVLIRRTRAAR